MQETIMAIGGHIGDMELTAGGLLATASLKGYKIITLALTAGEKGNPPSMSVSEYRKQKEEEAHLFAAKLNGEAVIFPYADGELPVDEKVKWMLAGAIRTYKPKFLITHWKHSIHKDHEATYLITKDAQFYAGLPGFIREQPGSAEERTDGNEAPDYPRQYSHMPAHYAAGPYYAENWEDPENFEPFAYFEVTQEGFDLWYEAINYHWFALNSTSFKYKEYYSALKKMRGCLMRKGYAEAFNVEAQDRRIHVSL